MGTYYGKPILWRCVDIDENGPLMLSDKILCIKAFDAPGDNTSGSHGRGYDNGFYRKQNGSNYWGDSNIRDWLNSESDSVEWSCGNPPNKDNLWNGYNAYDKEPGFLTNFTQSERDAILTVTQKALLDGYEYDSNMDENYHIYDGNIADIVQNYDTAYSEQVTDKMFLLDVKQINSVYNNLGDYYMAYPTQECVDNSEYKDLNLRTDNKWYYWLRSPMCSLLYGTCVRYVSTFGDIDDVGDVCYDIAEDDDNGIRPAFYLNLEASSIRDGAGTEYDPYTIGEENVYESNGINVGDYVQMGTYYGKPILWRCVDIDENGPLMLSDKILCIKAFDATGDNTNGSHGRGYKYDFDRKKWGSNYWADSNIRDWLNSESSSVAWSCGNPPDKEHVYTGYNAYDKEPGFLTNFTQSERDAILTVTQKALLDGYEYDSNMDENYHIYDGNIADIVQNYDTAYSEQVTDKMFLLDVKQINIVYNNLGDYYMAYPTQECIDNSEYKEYKDSSLRTDKKCDYWLRSPVCGSNTSYSVRRVLGNGTVSDNSAHISALGIRPAFYLNPKALSAKSGGGTEYDPYTIGDVNIYESNDISKTETSFGSTVSDWAETEIEEAYSKELIPDVLVGEDLTKMVNRAEFASIAVKLYKKLSENTASGGNNPFVDISDNACKDDIIKAYNLNITNGITDNTFEPSSLITREQAAAMLTRAYKKSEWAEWNLDNDSKYTLNSMGAEKFIDDAEISDWAKESVYFMVKKDVINGIGEGIFAPKANSDLGESYGYATREQALIIALRSVKNL